MKKFTQIWWLLIWFILPLSCSTGQSRQDIGEIISGPIDLVFLDETTLFISNSNFSQEFFYDGSVAVMDASNPVALEVSSAVSTPLFNGKMAFNTNAIPSTLFVTNRYSDDDLDFEDIVLQYDTTDPLNLELVRTIDVNDDPFGIDIAPAGDHQGRVFVTHMSTGVLAHFDGTNTNSSVEEISLSLENFDGSFSSAVAVSPDGARLVVTNIYLNVLYILDLTPPDDLTIEAVLYLNNGDFFANDARDALWLDTHRFVVANRAFDGIVVVDLDLIDGGMPLVDDTTTEELLLDINDDEGLSPVFLDFFSDPTSLAFDGTRIYVGEYGFNQIVPIDVNTLNAEESIQSGGFGPTALRFAPNSTILYVTNQLSNSIGIIDTSSDEHVGQFP